MNGAGDQGGYGTEEIQGMWAIFEVFFDTIVICTMTALVILCSSGGAAGLCAAHLDGAALAAWSFGAVCGKGRVADRAGHAGVFLCDHDCLVLPGEADAGGDIGGGGNDGENRTYPSVVFLFVFCMHCAWRPDKTGSCVEAV